MNPNCVENNRGAAAARERGIHAAESRDQKGAPDKSMSAGRFCGLKAALRADSQGSRFAPTVDRHSSSKSSKR